MLTRIHLILEPNSFFIRRQAVAKDGKEQSDRNLKIGSDNKRSPSLIYYHACEEEQDGASSSSLSSISSSSSKEIILTCLGQIQEQENDGSGNCTDAVSYAWVERQISQQENVSAVNMNMTRDAADGDAGATADAADVDADDLKRHIMSIARKEDITLTNQQQLEKEWFKGTLFYQDPGTPPSPPPKDYISVNFYFDCYDEEDGSASLYSQDQYKRHSQSIYSLAISSKIGSSLQNRRKSMAGKVRNAIKRRSSFFSHA